MSNSEKSRRLHVPSFVNTFLERQERKQIMKEWEDLFGDLARNYQVVQRVLGKHPELCRPVGKMGGRFLMEMFIVHEQYESKQITESLSCARVSVLAFDEDGSLAYFPATFGYTYPSTPTDYDLREASLSYPFGTRVSRGRKPVGWVSSVIEDEGGTLCGLTPDNLRKVILQKLPELSPVFYGNKSSHVSKLK